MIGIGSKQECRANLYALLNFPESGRFPSPRRFGDGVGSPMRWLARAIIETHDRYHRICTGYRMILRYVNESIRAQENRIITLKLNVYASTML
jgi:hypothetical protein